MTTPCSKRKHGPHSCSVQTSPPKNTRLAYHLLVSSPSDHSSYRSLLRRCWRRYGWDCTSSEQITNQGCCAQKINSFNAIINPLRTNSVLAVQSVQNTAHLLRGQCWFIVNSTKVSMWEVLPLSISPPANKRQLSVLMNVSVVQRFKKWLH